MFRFYNNSQFKCDFVYSDPRVESRLVEEEQETSINDDDQKKQHQLWLEREHLAQIEFNARKEKELREQLRKKFEQVLKFLKFFYYF